MANWPWQKLVFYAECLGNADEEHDGQLPTEGATDAEGLEELLERLPDDVDLSQLQ